MDRLLTNLLNTWNDPTMIGAMVIIAVLCLLSVGVIHMLQLIAYRKRAARWAARDEYLPVMKVDTFEPKLGYEPSNVIKMLDKVYE